MPQCIAQLQHGLKCTSAMPNSNAHLCFIPALGPVHLCTLLRPGTEHKAHACTSGNILLLAALQPTNGKQLCSRMNPL